MLLGKEKSCRKRDRTPKSLDRKKSLIKIPSTSKIPKDFFKASSGSPQASQKDIVKSMEFTFMPYSTESSNSILYSSLESPGRSRKSDENKTKLVKRMGRRKF